MSVKSKLLGTASGQATQFAEQYRKTVIKPAPTGRITTPISPAGHSLYRIED